MSAPHFFQKSIFRSVGAFARDRAGNIAIMFAVSILPLTIAVGAAMDYGNGLNVRPVCRAPSTPAFSRRPRTRRWS